MPRLRIAPQWLSEPLWIVPGRGEAEPVDLDDLGLSDDLADRIEEWIDAFDAVLDPVDPEQSRFPDAHAAIAWRREGEAIAAAVRRELGADWQVELILPATEAIEPR